MELTFPVGESPVAEQCINDILILQDNLFEGNPENLQDMTFRVLTSYNGAGGEQILGTIFITERSGKSLIGHVSSLLAIVQ